jgi:DNA invertase Pin-like site-specific DNA recombinase
VIAAAQYVRTSRRFEDLYLQRQQKIIADFARIHGFTIVKTYVDSGRSGLVLNGRREMQRLLRDVLRGGVAFQAILVYDVSRWGRFQDPDEAAHYEFLCKRSGMPVIYCNEPYINGKSFTNALFKNMRRGQAGEFSRELGEKIFRASRRIAGLGFRTGGSAGFGFRRVMVSADGQPLQVLKEGEYKSSQRNRVTLALGPDEEVKVVKDIFRMAMSNGANCVAIASELNRRGVAYTTGRPWDYYDVRRLITNPKYTGCCIWGRTSTRLKTTKRDIKPSEWIVRDGSFPNIIDKRAFIKVQELLDRRKQTRYTDTQLLVKLRALLRCKGKLSNEIIERSTATPTASTYLRHFGSLRKVYSLVGYKPEKGRYTVCIRRQETERLREQLFQQILELYPRDISVFRLPKRLRFIVRLDNGLSVSVVLCRRVGMKAGLVNWKIYPTDTERQYITLLCRLTPDNSGFLDFHLFAFIEKRYPYAFDENDCWFRSGRRLYDLKDLPEAAKLLSRMDDQSRDISPVRSHVVLPGAPMSHPLELEVTTHTKRLFSAL